MLKWWRHKKIEIIFHIRCSLTYLIGLTTQSHIIKSNLGNYSPWSSYFHKDILFRSNRNSLRKMITMAEWTITNKVILTRSLILMIPEDNHIGIIK